MYARKFLTSVASAAVAVSMVALTATSASATTDPQPDDTQTPVTPTAGHLIGVGSDTTQRAVKLVSDGFNATTPASPIFTYAACATPTTCGQITLPTADITRPNGSGAGKGLLYGGSGNAGNTDIDFARSSSGQNDAEIGAGLKSFPFALDTLVMVTAKTSNAPVNLTPAQIVGIYKEEINDWGSVGGTAGQPINQKLPQSSSGTFSFFRDQLKAANGGVAFTPLGATVQEHDDTDVKNDPNALAPFSIGRANLLGTLRNETGFSADRAVYNVVRGGVVGNSDILAAFGSDGYFCSPAAKGPIEAAGFKQLFTPAKGGACGDPVNSTSNFTVAAVQTTTNVTVTSASSSSAKIVAAVTGSTSPSGTVAFYEGTTLLQSGVPLVSGQATRIQPAAPGSHTYRAVFTPAPKTAFTTSEGAGTGSVQKATSSISEDYAKTVKAGKRAKGTVTVVFAGSSAKASGSVQIKEGKKVLVTKTLANGTVKIKLPKLSKGKHKLTIVWAGDANGTGSSLVFKIKQLKPKKK